MLSNPKITVLMPVYNCELYIQEAVDSILNQTFTDFEFLIIDDASTDETVAIIKTYNDPRIQLIQKPENSGYTNSLNHGLSIARGEYIARMDGDDISLPERFAKQVAFLDANQDVILCGTFYSIIGTERVVTVPENFEEIKIEMLWGCCVGHPTVMIRKCILDKFSIIYDVKKEPAEDYDLWCRLLSIGKLHNLQEVLLNYRVHNSQVSKKRIDQQINTAVETRIDLFNYLDFKMNINEYNSLRRIISDNRKIVFNEIELFQEVKNKLLSANHNNFFNPIGFQKYMYSLENRLFNNYFLKRESYSPRIFIDYIRISGKFKIKFESLKVVKLFAKSILFYKSK
jgi:glycosyltransferase involved in cell wall biosynthesis